jgi:hypothetical protein
MSGQHPRIRAMHPRYRRLVLPSIRVGVILIAVVAKFVN